MYLSDLIEKLEAEMDRVGDVPVCGPDDRDIESIEVVEYADGEGHGLRITSA